MVVVVEAVVTVEVSIVVVLLEVDLVVAVVVVIIVIEIIVVNVFKFVLPGCMAAQAGPPTELIILIGLLKRLIDEPIYRMMLCPC